MSTTSDSIHSEPPQRVSECGSSRRPTPPAGTQGAAAASATGTSTLAAHQAVVTPPKQSGGGSLVADAQKLAAVQQEKKPRKQLRAERPVKSGAHHANNRKEVFFSALEWKDRPFHDQPGEENYIIGSAQNVICWPFGKHVIQAPEKSFKTTFLKRLMAGMACGRTLFPQLPVNPKKRRILYTHGELSVPELEARTVPALVGLPDTKNGGLDGLIEGRCTASLIDGSAGEKSPQYVFEKLLDEIEPDIWVIDPWQEFVKGFDENSGKDMGRAQQFIDRMIREYGLTVFIVTHEGKDRSKGTRGWSGLAGWRDTLILLRPPKRDKSDGPAQGVHVFVEPRWAKPPAPFYIEFKDGTMWPRKTTDDLILEFLQTQPQDFEATIADLKAGIKEFKSLGNDKILKYVNRLADPDKGGAKIIITQVGRGRGVPTLCKLAPPKDDDAAPLPEDDGPDPLDDALGLHAGNAEND